jgi:hypothetical protein
MCRTALALRSTGRKRHAIRSRRGAVLYNGLRVVEDRGGTPGSCAVLDTATEEVVVINFRDIQD